VQGATKSSHTWVSAQRHEPLRSEGAEICEDTGMAKPWQCGVDPNVNVNLQTSRVFGIFTNVTLTLTTIGAQLTTAQLQTRVFPKQADAQKISHPRVR
jgi:hypothetical protein